MKKNLGHITVNWIPLNELEIWDEFRKIIKKKRRSIKGKYNKPTTWTELRELLKIYIEKNRK